MAKQATKMPEGIRRPKPPPAPPPLNQELKVLTGRVYALEQEMKVLRKYLERILNV